MPKLFFTEIPNRENIDKTTALLYPKLDHDTLFSHVLLRKMSTDLDSALESFFSAYGLSAGRFTLLTILNSTAEGYMPSNLAQQVGVTQATISGLINSLEKAGLVERTSHAKDGRSFVIILTAKGKELYQTIMPIYHQRIREFWNEFSADEKTQLNMYMERIVKRFSVLQPASL